MKKCALCPGYIDPDEDYVKYKRLPHHVRKKTAHLRCFIEKNFKVVTSHVCTPSDAVLIKAYQVCAWCRQIGIVVAELGRTNQQICACCNDKLQKLFKESEALNNLSEKDKQLLAHIAELGLKPLE